MAGAFDLKPLLKHISPDDYQTWINVGMALKHEGYPLEVWEEWSKGSDKFHDGECEDKWDSFNEQALSIVTGATITKLAKDGGWKKTEVENVDFNAMLRPEDLKIIDPGFVGDEYLKMPGNDWDPVTDAITFLNALFHPDEHVGFAFASFKDRDGKWKPKDTGDYYRTCGEVVARLKKYRRIDQGINSYEEEAGAWVRINPLDGQGGSDRNVTDYRYTLIESDEMALERQMALMKSLELPIAAMTYSGGKSIHAIVHVDADTYKEYQQRVDQIQKICMQNGLKVDQKNKNPSRFSRMPGVLRGDKKQFLISTNIGKPNYREWIEWVQDQNDDLPPFVPLDEVWGDKMPQLAPPLIDGILRQGHKCTLVGPSKSGKSFALMELAVAIAEGRTWFGWQCTQGKVLYVNFEIDDASFIHRFNDIYSALKIPPEHLGNIEVWNMRGHAQPMEKLVPKLIRRAKEQHFVCVIIDPIYKVISGDENAAGDMAKFGNEFDRICRSLQTAVVCCHHQSKGSQWAKKAQDRASGSGVFARDPDALIDMTEIPGIEGVYEVNGVLREFPSFPKFDVSFQYPLHIKLDHVYTEEDINALQLEMKQKKGNVVKSAKADMRKKEMLDFLEARLANGEPVTQKMLAELMKVSTKTIRRWFNEIDPGKKIYGVCASGDKYGQICRLTPFEPRT